MEMARQIANQLLSENLIACANILPQMESLYKWEGQLENSKEVVLILKTSDHQLNEAMERIAQSLNMKPHVF